MTDIIERLQDESQRLARLSFDTVDAGIAANVADDAMDEIYRLRAALLAERERCAKVATSFGDFPGERLVKELRTMCGNAIADKILELPIPAAVSSQKDSGNG